MLKALINWCEALDTNNKLIAAACNILRNTIHTDQLVSEQAALESLRNCTSVLNHVYPYVDPNYVTVQQCTFCQALGTYRIHVSKIYFGNTIAFECATCKAQFYIRLNP